MPKKEKETQKKAVKKEAPEKKTSSPKEDKKEPTIDEGVKQKVHDLLAELQAKADEVGDDVNQVIQALKTLGSLTLREEGVRKSLQIVRQLSRLNISKARYLLNPHRSIVVVGQVKIPPYTIVDLETFFPKKEDLDHFRHNPHFMEAVRSGQLLAFEVLDPNVLRKYIQELKDKPNNVFEAAEKLGIEQGTVELRNLVERDKDVVEFFKREWEKVKKEVGAKAVGNNTNIPL